jgi:PHP family Zn ribbon phosphoesterase
MVPGIGAATLKKMVMAFGSELAAAEADYEQLARVVGERLAEVICLARSGQGRFVSGGGGQYGRLLQG